MRRSRVLLAAAVCSILGAAVCSDHPHEFRVIALEEARSRLASGTYTLTLVETALSSPSEPSEDGDDGPQIQWQQPPGTRTRLTELPAGPLLIIASSSSAGYRSAAAAARSRGAEVLLFISESAEERRTLYAPTPAKGASS